MKKRGLSDIVATVLLVLLALAAIAIVWVFIRSTLNQTNTSIELNQKCLEVEVKPLRCQYSTAVPPTVPPTIRVQVVKGEPSQIVTILENSLGETFVKSETAPATLVTKDVDYTNSYTDVPLKARAAARVSDAQNNTLTCKESTIEIICVAVP